MTNLIYFVSFLAIVFLAITGYSWFYDPDKDCDETVEPINDNFIKEPKPEVIIMPVTNHSGVVSRYDVIADYGAGKKKVHICYQTKLYMATQVKDNIKKLLV